MDAYNLPVTTLGRDTLGRDWRKSIFLKGSYSQQQARPLFIIDYFRITIYRINDS